MHFIFLIIPLNTRMCYFCVVNYFYHTCFNIVYSNNMISYAKMIIIHKDAILPEIYVFDE